MNQYVGKICPYCKSIIKENDAIVVCSSCSMPHHRECWVENQGCTTFGCVGTIESPADLSPQLEDDFEIDFYSDASDFRDSYCPKCGSAKPSNGTFCVHCGYNFNEHSNDSVSYYPASNETSYGVSSTYYNDQTSTSNYGWTKSADEEYVDAMMEYVGTNKEYYRPIFMKFKKNGSFASWNWCSFFVSFLWSSYRKMYGVAASIFGILILLDLISDVSRGLSFIGYILYGIYGNRIYYNHIEKKMLAGKGLTEPYKSQHVIKNSGTSAAGIIVPIAGYFLLLFILFM